MSDPHDTPAREPDGRVGPGGDRVRELREHLEQARAALNALDRLLPAADSLEDQTRTASAETGDEELAR